MQFIGVAVFKFILLMRIMKRYYGVAVLVLALVGLGIFLSMPHKNTDFQQQTVDPSSQSVTQNTLPAPDPSSVLAETQNSENDDTSNIQPPRNNPPSPPKPPESPKQQAAPELTLEWVDLCDPNYFPCLPNVETLSCDELALKIMIIGKDKYGLDSDGNGVGCDEPSEDEPPDPDPQASAE